MRTQTSRRRIGGGAGPRRMGFLAAMVVVQMLVVAVAGQFGNIFEQFFQQQDDQEDRQAEHPGQASAYARLREATTCPTYLCPTTLECVSVPADCPCPFPEDIKCPISILLPSAPSDAQKLSASFVCTRAPGCGIVQQALKLGS